MKTRIINGIIEVEGGYVNDSSDSGGETNYGITKAAAVAYGYTGRMSDLLRQTAFDIYSAKYWDSVLGDKLILISELITEEIVDTSVNMGPNRAGKFLQRSLNTLNNQGKFYADIAIDGAIGNKTLVALKQYLTYRPANGGQVLVRMLNCLQGAFYVELAERRGKDEKFIYGWFLNRVS